MHHRPAQRRERGAIHIAALILFVVLFIAFAYLVSVQMELRELHRLIDQLYQEIRAGKGCAVS